MMILEEGEGGGQKQLLMMTVPSQCPSDDELIAFRLLCIRHKDPNKAVLNVYQNQSFLVIK